MSGRRRRGGSGEPQAAFLALTPTSAVNLPPGILIAWLMADAPNSPAAAALRTDDIRCIAARN